MLTPWKYTAGVELTFQPLAKDVSELSTELHHARSTTIPTMHKNLKGFYDRCGTDPDCIEIPTKILSSWDDAKKTITTVLEEAKKHGLVDKNSCSTGGAGHVHIGVSSKNYLTQLAVLREIHNRPYLCWFFANPDNTNQAKNTACKVSLPPSVNPYTPPQVLKKFSKLGVFDYGWKEIKKKGKDASDLSTCGKQYAVTVRVNTIEYRIFDCFMKYNNYEESLAFAQAYTSWIEQRVKDGDDFPILLKGNDDMLDKFDDYDKCVEDFKGLLKTLGLPWKRYAHYESNLEERFTDVTLLT